MRRIILASENKSNSFLLISFRLKPF